MKSRVNQIVSKAMQGDPVSYGSPSLPPDKCFVQGARGFENVLENEDPEICLNCELPPEKCRGSGLCYIKQKGRKAHEKDRH